MEKPIIEPNEHPLCIGDEQDEELGEEPKLKEPSPIIEPIPVTDTKEFCVIECDKVGVKISLGSSCLNAEYLRNLSVDTFEYLLTKLNHKENGRSYLG